MPVHNFVDLTNHRLDKCVVLEREPSKPGVQGTFWLCRYDCGHTRSVRTDKLRGDKAPACSACNPVALRTNAGVKASKGTKARDANPTVHANDVIRRALDDELMARMR